MASPHAVGRRGPDRRRVRQADSATAALTLSPDAGRAQAHAAPRPTTPAPPGGVQTYTGPPNPAQYTATCEGGTAFNGFYGDGIVNALGAVTGRR